MTKSHPKTAQPWPRRAEGYRVDAFEAAQEIARLAREVQPNPNRNIYRTQVVLAEILSYAEYIQRVLVEAAQGTAPDRALEALEARVAELEQLMREGRVIPLRRETG